MQENMKKKNQILIMIWNCYHFFLKHKIYKELKHFLKIHIYSEIFFFKKHVMYMDNYKHLLYNLQKIFFKNSFVWKSYFWAKWHVVLF